MSIELIAIIVFAGLLGYLLGRMARKRREARGQMLINNASHTFDPARPAAAAFAPNAGALDAASLEEIKRLLRERQLIAAIKVYRERTNCGLREAKDAVESIMKSL